MIWYKWIFLLVYTVNSSCSSDLLVRLITHTFLSVSYLICILITWVCLVRNKLLISEATWKNSRGSRGCVYYHNISSKKISVQFCNNFILFDAKFKINVLKILAWLVSWPHLIIRGEGPRFCKISFHYSTWVDEIWLRQRVFNDLQRTSLSRCPIIWLPPSLSVSDTGRKTEKERQLLTGGVGGGSK